jgi:hypothetical protein
VCVLTCLATPPVEYLYKMEAANERTLTQARAHESESRHRNPAHGQSPAPIREKVLKRGGKRTRSKDRVQEEADTGVQPSAATVNTESAEATGAMDEEEQTPAQGVRETQLLSRHERGMGQQRRRAPIMPPPQSRNPRTKAGRTSRSEPEAAGSDHDDPQNSGNEQATAGEEPEHEGQLVYGPTEQQDGQGTESASGLAAARIMSRSELDGRAAASQRLGTRGASGTDSSAAGDLSASRLVTYGPGTDWSHSQGTAGR